MDFLRDQPRKPRDIVADLLNIPREAGQPSDATESQLSAAQILFVLHLDELLTEQARRAHGVHPHADFSSVADRDIRRARNAMTVLYVLKTYDLPLDKFRRRWKEKAPTYERMLDAVLQEIEVKRSAIFEHASQITDDDRREITKIALKKMHRRRHRHALEELSEPDKKKRKQNKKRRFISGAISAAAVAVATGLTVPVGRLAATVESIDMSSIYNWKTLTAVAASYGFHYLSLHFDSRAMMRLLSDPHINVAPSIGATEAYKLADRLVPEDETVKRRAVFGGTAFLPVAVEPALIVGLLLPFGPLATITRNVAGGITYLLEAAGSHGWGTAMDRRWKRRQMHHRRTI